MHGDRLAAAAAASPQQQPGDHRNVLVPRQPSAAAGAVGRADCTIDSLGSAPQRRMQTFRKLPISAPEQRRQTATPSGPGWARSITRDLIQENAGGDGHVERLDPWSQVIPIRRSAAASRVGPHAGPFVAHHQQDGRSLRGAARHAGRDSRRPTSATQISARCSRAQATSSSGVAGTAGRRKLAPMPPRIDLGVGEIGGALERDHARRLPAPARSGAWCPRCPDPVPRRAPAPSPRASAGCRPGSTPSARSRR